MLNIPSMKNIDIPLYDHQKKALKLMKNGCILNGGVGSGKSRTALAYFFMNYSGENDRDLYIITTARKRDTHDWEEELEVFHSDQKVIIDSWNNIYKYINKENCFFIFDEQRVVGSGLWAKSFIKIAKANDWILLSATPGDVWTDYIPVFIANNFYKNRSEFLSEHAIYSRWSKYPKIERYIGISKLNRLRNDILINMEDSRTTVPHHIVVDVEYDKDAYNQVSKYRWNIYKNEPIANISELCSIWKQIVNSDSSRVDAILDILKKKRKIIVFYNFNYELDILKSIKYDANTKIAEWNGHKHELIPTGDSWVYLVQYTAGAEGWNCIDTDTIVFFSQNYSYKIMKQAAGRIDRINTSFQDLFYYHLKSSAPIDRAISRALKNKEIFNESKFIKW